MTSPYSVSSTVATFGEANSLSEWIRLAANRFVPLSLSTDCHDAFRASMRSQFIEGTHVSQVEATRHRVQRRSSDISKGDANLFKFTVQLEGVGIVAQDGRETVLQKGDSAIYDTSRPYTLEYLGDMRTLIMAFPPKMLGLSAALVNNLTAVRLAGNNGIGLIISPFMQHMAENIDQLTGAHGTRIVRSAVDMIGTMLSAQQTERDLADEGSHPVMDAVRLYIEGNLDDASLNAAKVARVHFVSLRYLQYLFHQDGQTLSDYIRRRRLDRCRLDLQDPALQSRTIVQIAQSRGFTDPSHFSKLFKVTYSYSPREYRAQYGLPTVQTNM